jgi:hypothetical protein
MSRFLVRMLPVLLLPALALALSGGVAHPVAARGLGSVSGTIYFDINMNWERDSGDLPAAHQTVELRDQEDDQLVSATESATDGTYKFSDLSPTKTYQLALLPGDETLCLTMADRSDLSGDKDWTGIDLGMIQRGKGVISGTLLDDLNENGAGDPGEPGVPGWGVWLETGSEGALGVCTVVTTTDANGHFEIAGLPSHVYSFAVEPQETEALWELTFPTKPSPDAKTPNLRVPKDLDLSTVSELRGLKIGVHVLKGSAAIAGSMFCDYDADQVRDDDEWLFDCWWTAFLSLEREVPSIGVLSLSTDTLSCEDRQVLISGLPAGTYMVGVVPDWCGMGPCFRWQVTLSDGQRSENNDIPIAGCEKPPSATPEPPTPISPTPTPILTPAPSGAVTPPSSSPALPCSTDVRLVLNARAHP